MTKFYPHILIITLLSFGCSQNRDLDTYIIYSDISFSVGIDDQITKGTMASNEEQMASMGVYCALTMDEGWDEGTEFNIMENQQLDYSKDDASWIYYKETPSLDYTSISDKYTFMAYSPHGNSDNGITPRTQDGDLIITYNVPEVCGSQPDLMLAIPQKNIYPQLDGDVSLYFKHTLAAIGFSVKGSSVETITEITITNVVASGEVSIADDGEVTWSPISQSELSYSANINSEIEPDSDISKGLTLTDGYLMMIPQECDQVEITVKLYNSISGNYTTKTISLNGMESWEAGKEYNYTLNISEYDYTIEGTSNCYILHPNGEDQTFYIPVEGRINTFWRDYADDNQTYKDMLSSNDEWEAYVLWSDISGSIRRFSVERVTSGFSPSESVTPLCEPDFTTPGARSAMKITLSNRIIEGNILVAVALNDQILWSWHLWITDYNPDIIAANNSATEGQYTYTTDGVEGAVHRYDSKDLWSTLYNDRFIMDRNLGARDCDYEANKDGVLHYQFGRKDPFPATSSVSIDLEEKCVPFSESVQNPTTFYTRKSNSSIAFSWSEEGLTMSNNYLWFDKNVLNSTEASGKSIFDPSPLGWRVPRYGTFTVMNTGNCQYYSDDNMVLYNGFAKLPMTGYRSNHSGSVNDYGSQGNIRLATQIDESYAYNLVYNPDIEEKTNNTLADGFSVRCIEE